MKLAKFLAFTFGAAVFLSACRNNDTDGDDDLDPILPETLVGDITTSKTLTNDRVWILKGQVKVKNGATLTVQEGTVVKSDVTEKGSLIITRGCKLMAIGTADKPIVFTSGKAPGTRGPGDWGGIVLLGSAPTNKTNPQIEGGIGEQYGGTDAADNSGTLKYVRIEYAGIAAFQNSEINSLTLGGVGSGTTIDYVMTAYANDDAFEIFGGTVNPRHLVAYATADDDFDFDFGYTGTVQYAVSLRDPKFVDPGDAGNGIECDNDGQSSNQTPFTRPVISNMTIVGPNGAAGTASNHNYGNRWRRATNFVFLNSIILGTQKGGTAFESKPTYDYFLANAATAYSNNIIFTVATAKTAWTDSSTARLYTTGYPNPMTSAQRDAMIAEASAPLLTKLTDAGNTVAASADFVGLTDPFNLANPNFLPKTGSPALSGTFKSFAGIDNVTYRGAFGSTNWLTGWTNFDPQNKVY
ncbi:hypothetical protein [Chitinophaga sp. 22620]|uniref:hypothetical protein n=1 Tax=Chitinophaga sp. 22620 TaxID=3453952 RepID=UPI003F87F5EE